MGFATDGIGLRIRVYYLQNLECMFMFYEHAFISPFSMNNKYSQVFSMVQNALHIYVLLTWYSYYNVLVEISIPLTAYKPCERYQLFRVHPTDM